MSTATAQDLYEDVDVRLPAAHVDLIQQMAEAKGQSFDELAQDILARFLSADDKHFVNLADRGFLIAVDDTDNGHSAAGHVRLFQSIARSQARALWLLLDDARGAGDPANDLSADEIRALVAGIDLTLSVSEAMAKEIAR